MYITYMIERALHIDANVGVRELRLPSGLAAIRYELLTPAAPQTETISNLLMQMQGESDRNRLILMLLNGKLEWNSEDSRHRSVEAMVRQMLAGSVLPFRIIDIPQRKTKPKTPIEFTPSGIIISTEAINFSLGGEVERRSHRIAQRIGQFKNLVSKAAELERYLEGSIDPEDVPHYKRLLFKLREIESTWAVNELAGDPLSKIVASEYGQQFLPQSKHVLEAVQNELRIYSFNLSDIHREVDGILNPPKEKETEPGAVRPQKTTEEGRRVHEENTSKELAEAKKELEEVHKEKAEVYKVKTEGVNIAYDPAMDAPSKVASNYFEELFNRPF